jgi:hypothetical protein
MPLGAFYRHRRLAGALALLGMAFYVVLVPWHTLSQTTLQLSQTSPLAARCPHAMAGENSKPSKPEKPRTHCPICNGLAALQTAISAPVASFVLRILEEDVEQAARQENVADAPAHTPQSRGPPFLI